MSVKEQGSRSFFIQPEDKDKTIAALLQTCPQVRALVIRAADKVCEHEFDLLGSGPTTLSWPIDWHTDFKSGFRWDPAQYYSDIRPAPYPGGYDLKVPWELSRCQHFLWLGQAYWLSADEKYALEFRLEVEDWIRQNPPEFGVNWACSMDIAIRAVNWLWGYAFFRASPTLDDDFLLAFYSSLLSHGRHIRSNLEGTATFRGNHYLSDIVGLIYLGILIPEFKEAKAWREFGLQELEREIFKQTYLDGGNFEASTYYHRLVSELFTSATLLAQQNGHIFSAEYMKRLEKMLDVVYYITKPDGTAPIIGDQDNGRLHRLKIWTDPDREWKDFRSLLAVGSILFDKTEWGKIAIDHWEEATWLFGEKALHAFQKARELPSALPSSMELKHTGIYIMRVEDIFVAVDAGSIGQNGKGGHAHNDSLSFELFSSGRTWIQDPGTYVYTADYEARNRFRSTEYHNTVSFPGSEQNGCDVNHPFFLREESDTGTLSPMQTSGSVTRFEAEVKHFRHPKVSHRRAFRLDHKHRALLITDRIEGTALSALLMFHFSPGIELETMAEPYLGLKMRHADGQVAWLISASRGGVEVQISDGWVSESYGTRVPAKVAALQLDSNRYHTSAILLPDTRDISGRIKSVLEDENRSH